MLQQLFQKVVLFDCEKMVYEQRHCNTGVYGRMQAQCTSYQYVRHVEYLRLRMEYRSVPMIVIVDPKMPSGEIGLPKTITDVTMRTTRLIVFPTE